MASTLALPAVGAHAEQHGDGYGSRSADDRDYGGGQGQYDVILPAPLYYAPPYYAAAPAPYPTAPGYPGPDAYRYAPRPYPPRRLPPLRAPVAAYPYGYPYPPPPPW